MAVHKVPQDVEADDKFLGPLSFKQFLFFGGMAICGYLSFLTITRVWPVSIVFIIPTLLFAVLAFPWSKEQPTELFLASRIRFLIKPRKRIWDQSGVKDLVNITVPIREAHIYSDGLSQGEVRNRMSALATMVDSRGWAVKNVTGRISESDRLINPVTTVPDEKTVILNSTQDIFDESSGTIAKQFDNMIEQSEQQHKSETLKLVDDARKAVAVNPDIPESVKPSKKSPKTPDQKNNQDFWFLHQQPQPSDPSLATFQTSSVINPGTSTSQAQTASDDASTKTDLTEEELLKTVHEKQARDALQTAGLHIRVIDPNGPTAQAPNQEPTPQNIDKATSTMTPPLNPDILNLSRSNDLSVETLARQANKTKDFGDDEVVISLH